MQNVIATHRRGLAAAVVAVVCGMGFLPAHAADLQVAGTVVLDHREGSPVPGAVVSAGGVQTTSDAEGRFVLTLPERYRGGRVSLAAKARGRVMIHQHVQDVALPLDGIAGCRLVVTAPENKRMAQYRHFLSVLRELCSLELRDQFDDRVMKGEAYGRWTTTGLLLMPHAAWLLSDAAYATPDDPLLREVLGSLDRGAVSLAREQIRAAAISDPLAAALLQWALLDFAGAEERLMRVEAGLRDYRLPYTLALFASAAGRFPEAAGLLREVLQMKCPSHVRALAQCHLASVAELETNIKNVADIAARAVDACREIYAHDQAIAPLLAANQVLRAHYQEFSRDPGSAPEQHALAIGIADGLRQSSAPSDLSYYTNPFALGLNEEYLRTTFYLKLHGPGHYRLLDVRENYIGILPFAARAAHTDYLAARSDVGRYRQGVIEILERFAEARENDPTRAIHHFVARILLRYVEQQVFSKYNNHELIALCEQGAEMTRPNLAYVYEKKRSCCIAAF